MRGSVSVIALCSSIAFILTGCEFSAGKSGKELSGGNRDRGASLISHYGCGSCHTVPGVAGAHGLVGPSLAGLRTRVYIAGSLANNLPSVEHWIQDPHSFNGKTVMPNLGVTAHDAVV